MKKQTFDFSKRATIYLLLVISIMIFIRSDISQVTSININTKTVIKQALTKNKINNKIEFVPEINKITRKHDVDYAISEPNNNKLSFNINASQYKGKHIIARDDNDNHNNNMNTENFKSILLQEKDTKSLQSKASLEAFEDSFGLFRKRNKSTFTREERSIRQSIPLEKINNSSKCMGTIEKIPRIPAIVVVSNRRSGTHMTMDLLHNIYPGNKIILKANHIQSINGELDCRCRNWLMHNMQVIHAHRNILDVVVSYYHYRRTYDSNFRKIKWKDFVAPGSKSLETFLKSWVDTVHGWYTQDFVFNLSFEDTIKLDRKTLKELSDFINIPMTKNESQFIKSNWNIQSRPVLKGAGKGTGGFQALMDEMIRKNIINRTSIMPQWKKDTLLDCKNKPFKHDEICIKPDGRRTLIRNEKDCIKIGIREGEPRKGKPQSYFCMPKSCPTDLKQGILIINWKNKTIYKKRSPLGFRD